MRGFAGFTKRNLKLYFKDVQSVIFSLLTSIIVFVLYLLFLKNTFIDSLNGAMQGLEGLIKEGDLDMLVNGLLLTGIMGSALITVPFNCLMNIVKDREMRIDYDISATPMKRWQIIFSYFVSAVISACIMAGIILTVGLIALNGMGDASLEAMTVVKLYGIIVLGAVSATALFMIVVQFFKSSSASGAFFGILSAASGFVIGAYMPISQFSDKMQTVCNLFPGSHITTLFRSLIMGGILDRIDADLAGLDGGAFAAAIKDTFVFKAKMFGETVSSGHSILYIGLVAVVCVVVMILLFGKTYRRK